MPSPLRLPSALALVWLTACGGTPRDPVEPARPGAASRPGEAPRPPAPDPDLDPDPEAAPRLLSIDWTTVPLATDADALAVWQTIAPTGADWEAKLDEVPLASARPLAIALLRAGGFTCVPPSTNAGTCSPLVLDVAEPAPTATAADPCLRRMLALWSLAALEDADVPQVLPALKAIAAIPPPESQLVAAAIQVVPEADPATRLELMAIAHAAGQRDVANGLVGTLDEAHVIEAATRHHLDAALDVLSAEHHRAVYLGAMADEAMLPAARIQAITELVAAEDTLAPETRKALVAATRAKDCGVAAAAARALALRGDRKYVPRRPATRSQAAMMRALCVLVSYERLQGSDEDSLLGGFVPPKGLEHVRIAFDPLAEIDTDGDGDPRTDRQAVLVPRAEVVVPEVDDLARALRTCTATVCRSPDREFRFGLKTIGGALYLARLEIAELPPCP